MWFLYQIKRFFFILKKESFLFIRIKIVQPIKKAKDDRIRNHYIFSQKKGRPNLQKEIPITLNDKYYDFYTLQPKNEKPFYTKSLLFNIIKNHKIEIFNNLIYIFKKSYSYQLKIGIEIEFYLSKVDKKIIDEIKKILPENYILEPEEGKNQLEIKTYPYLDIERLVDDYIVVINGLNRIAEENKIEISFETSPFENDCSSALQVNISMINQNSNLFARTKNNNNFTESELMLNCLAGLLKNINKNLLLYIKDSKCLKRFDLDRNILIRDNGKYPAPTFVSWGINNRSASIRIPTPNVTDYKKYMDEDNKNRRIEYRIPSSAADIYLVMIGIISSLIEGIENQYLPTFEKTQLDILNNNNGLEKIDMDFENINDIFEISENILFF